MNVKLPNINMKKIADSKLAAQVTQLVNIVEDALKKINSLTHENSELKKELGRLKKQAAAPKFEKKDYSATKKMEANPKKIWKKSTKKDSLAVDDTKTIPQPTQCSSCGGTEFKTTNHHERVVQDITIKRNNILYQWTDSACVNCGKIHKGELPKEVRGQEFGASLRAWTSVFKYDDRFTLPLLHRFYTGIGIRISTGELSHIVLTNSKKLKGAYVYLKAQGFKVSTYLQSDATCFKRKLSRRGSKILSQHLNFFGHKYLSIFKITPHYNASTVSRFLGKAGRKLPFVSDDASCYGKLLMVLYKQLCWLHEIRHYLKLDPRLAQHKKIHEKAIGQLWEFYQQAKAYCLDPTDEAKAVLQAQFIEIFTQKTGYTALDHQYGLTLKKIKRLLVFLDHPFVPIQNNESEQGVRDAVMIRVISRETKSTAGDRSLERHLSIIQTAKKQGLNVFDTVYGLLNDTVPPSVLLCKTV